jgi:hypothetical protein
MSGPRSALAALPAVVAAAMSVRLQPKSFTSDGTKTLETSTALETRDMFAAAATPTTIHP